MTQTTDPELQRWLQSVRRNCVVLKRGESAAIDAAGGSFFGGHPKLAPGMAWPTIAVDGADVSMLFLGQIDLGDLPEFERRHLLPPTGTLYFFYLDRWDWEGASAGMMPCAVLYSEASAASFAPCAPPLPLAAPNPELGDMGAYPDSGARAEVSFAACDSYPDAHDDAVDALSVSQRDAVSEIIHRTLPDGPPHQLLGYACVEHVFVGPARMPGKSSLLRISSGDTIFRGSPEYRYEGAFNFWIAPDDLARCDFTNVRMSC